MLFLYLNLLQAQCLTLEVQLLLLTFLSYLCLFTSPIHPKGVDHPPLKVFTTRPDIIFGATFLAISPEHELLEKTQLFSGPTLQAIQELQRETRSAGTLELQDRPKRGMGRWYDVIETVKCVTSMYAVMYAKYSYEVYD